MQRLPPWLAVVLVVPVGLALAFTTGHFAAAKPGSFSWETAAAAATAYGTLALALVTWRLVKSTGDSVSETRKLATLAQREKSERLFPFVFPITDRRWLTERAPSGLSIAVRNGAPGLALNVTGHIYWSAGNAEMTCASLAGGDHATVHLGKAVPSWDGVWGSLTYMDLEQRKWETRFEYEQRPDGRIRAVVCAYGLAERLPKLAHPAGWEMPNGLARICLPPVE